MFREWITSEGDVDTSHAETMERQKPWVADAWTTIERAMARAGTKWLHILKVMSQPSEDGGRVKSPSAQRTAERDVLVLGSM